MTSIIYVPQGKSARLHIDSPFYDIEGLYTDSFSSCVIITCIGEKQITLIHADPQINPNRIKQEIEWVGEPNEIIFLVRDDGKVLLGNLLNFLHAAMPSKKFICKKVNDQDDGIYVSFNQQKNNDVHPQVKKFPVGQKPQNLLHHPQEQRFLAVQKIEQIIGLRAKQQTKKFRDKPLLIFDGLVWEILEDWLFSIDTSHALTKKEMKIFSKNDPYISLTIKLDQIISKIGNAIPVVGNLSDFSMSVACYLEDYLNNFDCELLFKRNMKDLLDNLKQVPGYNPISSEDKALKIKLLQLFKQQDFVFERAEKLIAEYKDNAPETEFKKNILDEYQVFSRHYYDRRYYKDLADKYEKKLLEAENLRDKAVAAYQLGDYSAAEKLFLTVIQNITHCCTKSNANLATAYYNYGRNLYQLERFQEAKFFLYTSLALKKNYVVPKPSLSDIEATEKALQECQQQLEKGETTYFGLLSGQLANKEIQADKQITSSIHQQLDAPPENNSNRYSMWCKSAVALALVAATIGIAFAKQEEIEEGIKTIYAIK